MKRFGVLLLVFMLLYGCLPARAQSEAEDIHTLRWYCNPKGGKYAHLDPNCVSVSPEYLPLQPVPDGEQAFERPLCPYCVGEAAPIFSTSGGSANLPNLQVDVYPTSLKVPEWEEDPVYRIHITDMDRPTHVFPDLLFPSLEGGESMVPLVRIEDLNFDGYPDLAALYAQGASNVSCTYFLCSPDDGRYLYEPVFDDLSAYALYPEQKMISSSIHESAECGIRELYQVGEDGQPALYRRASILRDEHGDGQNIRIKVTSYDSTGAESVLMDEVREPFVDDKDYLESEQQWLRLLYDGIPEAVIKGDLGEYDML